MPPIYIFRMRREQGDIVYRAFSPIQVNRIMDEFVLDICAHLHIELGWAQIVLPEGAVTDMTRWDAELPIESRENNLYFVEKPNGGVDTDMPISGNEDNAAANIDENENEGYTVRMALHTFVPSR